MKKYLQKIKEIKHFLLSAIALTFMSNVFAANWYVSTTGSDANAGTSAGAAFLTIQKAINSAAANDVVYIAAGTYNNPVSLTKSLTFNVDNVVVTVKSILMKTATSVNLTLLSTTTSGTINITDSLELTSGYITTSGTVNTNMKTANGCKIVGGSKNSFVIGGFWIGQSGASAAMTWPVGVGTDYRPVTLNSYSKSGTSLYYFFAKVINGGPAFTQTIPSATTRNISKMHHWYLSTDAPTANASSFVLKFNYDSVSNDDYVYDAANLQLLYSPGTSPWVLSSTGGTAARMGTITGASVATLGNYFILGNKIGSATTLGGTNTLGNTEPFASFTYTGKCEADTFVFTSISQSTGSLINNYTWDFGDGTSTVSGVSTVKHKFKTGALAASYTFTVTLTIYNSNSGTNTDAGAKQILIYNSPRQLLTPNIYTQSADLLPKTVTAVCQGQTTRITDTYNPPVGESMLQKIWTITPPIPVWTKGGTVPTAGYKDSTAINYKFPGAGTYKIYIQRKTSYGCIALDSTDYILHAKPSVSIDMKDMCWDPVKSALITNLTADPTPDKMQSWIWNLGDGTILNGKATPLTNKSIAHRYVNPGVYSVKLVVTTDANCKDSSTMPINIFAKPVAAFGLTTTCVGDTTKTLDYSTVSSPESFQYYIWNFGDGTPSDTFSTAPFNDIHGYNNTGVYKVLLKLITFNGCTDTQAVWHRIHPNPTPKYQVKQVCFGDTTRMRRIIDKYPRKDSMNWKWYIDGLAVSYDSIYKGVLPAPGVHNATLIGTSKAGCIDSTKGVFQVYYIPKPTIGIDKSIPGNDSIQCQYMNSFASKLNFGIDPNDTLQVAYLNYGDSKKDSFLTATSSSLHHYDTTGIYRNVLIVKNVHGCKDSAIVPYRVVGTPYAHFNYKGLCMPDSVLFYDTLSTSVNPIVKRYWDFGNGTIDSMKTRLKVYYKDAGPYTAAYVVVTANPLGKPGDFKYCFDSMQLPLNSLINRPVINWTMSGSMPLCKGDSATFTVTGGDSVSWLKDLDTAKVKAFSKTGNYKFLAYNKGVCYSMDSVQVYAYPPANIVAHNDTAIFRGRKANAFVTNALKNFHWFPGKYVLDSTKVSVTTIPLVDSITLFVIATDSNGCTDLDSVHIRVLTPPLVKIPNLITPNKDKLNEYWDLIEIPDILLYDIILSDRQGKRVYSTSNYMNDWNAVDSDGNELPTGVYFYYMKNRQTNDEFRGYIQVIR